MIEVNGHILMSDEMRIMEELKAQLAMNGKSLFHKFVITSNNIQTTCPFHKDGQEKKPSFGILTKDRGKNKAGTCHCFACGWSGTLAEMISNCFGYDDLGLFGSKWLVKNFLTVGVENRRDIDLGFNEEEKIQYIGEEELEIYREYHPYMWKRKMTPDIVELFDVGYDRNTECLTFPVRNVKGQCLFIARRSVNSKYFNYPGGTLKPLYGLYELSTLSDIPDEVYICESMINAITVWTYGKYAIALNGTGSHQQLMELRKLPFRKYILALDPDSAGEKGKARFKKVITNKLITEVQLPKGKDVNDLSKEEFLNLVEYL